MKPIIIPKLSDHGSEIVLLGILGSGVLTILGIGIFKGVLGGRNAIDVAAFLLVLQRIVEAIQKRWEQRGADRLGALAAAGQPATIADTPQDAKSAASAVADAAQDRADQIEGSER